MSFIFWFCRSVIFCLPLFKNPISMAAMVVAISLLIVRIISLFSSFWFSYVLFLVYVGGLLVIFIYICLVRRNFPFKFRINGLLCILFGSYIISLKRQSPYIPKFLGSRTWTGGEGLIELRNISIFIFLAVLLLIILLVVVRVSRAGCFIVRNEKN